MTLEVGEGCLQKSNSYSQGSSAVLSSSLISQFEVVGRLLWNLTGRGCYLEWALVPDSIELPIYVGEHIPKRAGFSIALGTWVNPLDKSGFGSSQLPDNLDPGSGREENWAMINCFSTLLSAPGFSMSHPLRVLGQESLSVRCRLALGWEAGKSRLQWRLFNCQHPAEADSLGPSGAHVVHL